MVAWNQYRIDRTYISVSSSTSQPHLTSPPPCHNGYVGHETVGPTHSTSFPIKSDVTVATDRVATMEAQVEKRIACARPQSAAEVLRGADLR
jgi:hypothetical protein